MMVFSIHNNDNAKNLCADNKSIDLKDKLFELGSLAKIQTIVFAPDSGHT